MICTASPAVHLATVDDPIPKITVSGYTSVFWHYRLIHIKF